MRLIPAAFAGGVLALAGTLTTSAHAATPIGDRIASAAAELAGERIPYVAGSLGSPHGPEQAGLPPSGLDCMTFVEAALMRAQQIRSPAQQQRWLRQTRYDGKAPAYCARAHYLSDWAERNSKQGWIGEITQDIAAASGTPLQYHRWRRTWLAAHDLDPAGCTDEGDAPAPLAYIAPDDYARVAAGVAPGDILTFVAREAGLDSVHVAIAQAGGGLAMASSISGGTVLKPSWVDYAKERSKFLGLRVFRVREPERAGTPGGFSAAPSAARESAARAP